MRFVRTATRAVRLLLARGNADHARMLAEQALTIDPWLEAAHHVVVASYRAVGHDLAAHRAVDRYREALSELGVTPDQARRLVDQMLAGMPPRRD